MLGKACAAAWRRLCTQLRRLLTQFSLAFLHSRTHEGTYIRLVLPTIGRGLDVQREAVDRRSRRVTRHVEGPGQTCFHPDLVPRPKQTEKHVCKLYAILDAVDLVFTRVTSKSQEDFLAVCPLACRYVGRQEGAAGLQTVFGRIHHTVVARPGVYGAAALVPKVCSGISIGLGREEVDE